MKKVLTKIENNIYYFKDGVKILGIHSNISGDISGIRGDISEIRGDISGIRGDISGIRGNLDDAGITDEERTKGVYISDLCK